MKKLVVKIEKFEQIQQEKLEAMREMEMFNAPDDDFIPPSPDLMEEEEATPPFDPSPPPSPVYVSSQRTKPPSPLQSIQKSLNFPCDSSNINGQVIAPKAKFSFKKPGMNNSLSVASLSASTSKIEHLGPRSS